LKCDGFIAMPDWKFLKKLLGPRQEAPADERGLRIRFAVEEDADALTRLARLDCSRPPRGPVLVAEVGRSIWAALSLDSLQAVADPRRPTGELVWILVERAREVRRAEGGRTRGLPRVFPRGADDQLEPAF
jgi:hypothetical protein